VDLWSKAKRAECASLKSESQGPYVENSIGLAAGLCQGSASDEAFKTHLWTGEKVAHRRLADGWIISEESKGGVAAPT